MKFFIYQNSYQLYINWVVSVPIHINMFLFHHWWENCNMRAINTPDCSWETFSCPKSRKKNMSTSIDVNNLGFTKLSQSNFAVLITHLLQLLHVAGKMNPLVHYLRQIQYISHIVYRSAYWRLTYRYIKNFPNTILVASWSVKP